MHRIVLAGVIALAVVTARESKLPWDGGFPVSDTSKTDGGTSGPNAGMPWRQFRYPAIEQAGSFLLDWAKRMPHLARFDTCQRRYGLPTYGSCKRLDGSMGGCEQRFLVITNWDTWAGYAKQPSEVSNQSASYQPYNGRNGAGRDGSEGARASVSRPHVLISGSIHGNEKVGPLATLAAVELLLRNYELFEQWEGRCGKEGTLQSDSCLVQRRALAHAVASAPNSRNREQVRLSNLQGRNLRGVNSSENDRQTTADSEDLPTLPYNPWLKHLVDTRVFIALPMGNPDGYANNRRGETNAESDGNTNLDPNRDFPYDGESRDTCMQTITGRCINEIYRDHLVQTMITFHGGDHSISYEWGAYMHQTASSEAPDDESQANTAVAMQHFGGVYPSGKLYDVGRMNPVMYPVNGGLEDWSYAASWDTSGVQSCTPTTYGGYPAYKTVYNDAMLRSSTFLVETNDAKVPAAALLGYWGPALLHPVVPAAVAGGAATGPGSATASYPSGVDPGEVPRNLRLILTVLDLVEPYTQALSVSHRVAPAVAAASSDSIVRPASTETPVAAACTADSDMCAGVMVIERASDLSDLRHGYNRWIELDDDTTTTTTAAAGAAQSSNDNEGGDALEVVVDVSWDVGGAIAIDETGVLVLRWPVNLPTTLGAELVGQSRMSDTEIALLTGGTANRDPVTNTLTNGIGSSGLAILNASLCASGVAARAVAGVYASGPEWLATNGSGDVVSLSTPDERHRAAASWTSNERLQEALQTSGFHHEKSSDGSVEAVSASSGSGDALSLAGLLRAVFSGDTAGGTSTNTSSSTAHAAALARIGIDTSSLSVGPIIDTPVNIASPMSTRWSDPIRKVADVSLTPYKSIASATVGIPIGTLTTGAAVEGGGHGGSVLVCPDQINGISACEQETASVQGGNSHGTVHGFVIIPYAKVDSHWSRQEHVDPPNTPPQTHMTNVRLRHDWRKQNRGFKARGRSYFTGSAVYIGVSDKRLAARKRAAQVVQTGQTLIRDLLGMPQPIQSPSPSSSPSPTHLPSTDGDNGGSTVTASPSPGSTVTASPSPGSTVTASPCPSSGSTAPFLPDDPAACQVSDTTTPPSQSVPFFWTEMSASDASYLAQALTCLVAILTVWWCGCRGRVMCGRRCPGHFLRSSGSTDDGAEIPIWCGDSSTSTCERIRYLCCCGSATGTCVDVMLRRQAYTAVETADQCTDTESEHIGDADDVDVDATTDHDIEIGDDSSIISDNSTDQDDDDDDDDDVELVSGSIPVSDVTSEVT